MNIHWHSATDEIDAVYAPTPDWEFEVFQLSTGLLGFKTCMIELPGLTIAFETMDQRIRSFQKRRKTGFHVGFLVSAKAPLIWKGCEASRKLALVFGRDDHELLIPADTVLLSIETDVDTADALGLMLLESGLWDCDLAALGQLELMCTALAKPQQATGNRPARDKKEPSAISETILAQCLATLVKPTHSRPSRHYDIVEQTMKCASDMGWTEGMGVDFLSDEIGVPRRTVHRAFKGHYGRGPSAYLRLVRLHQFHRALLDGNVPSVTDAALGAGFEHFGRAANYYRQQFGKLPKHTFKRANTHR